MSNKENKPKMTSMELVKKMRDEKGITFNYMSESDAAEYLLNINNYMRTASYRKNYTKYQKGKNTGKYENLDFAYLKELSTIDMYYRSVVNQLCLDIEHALKVRILNKVENSHFIDGYIEVNRFLSENSKILGSIAKRSRSTYTKDLICKYFQIDEQLNSNGKKEKIIASFDDCPMWVLVELLSFGDLISLYEMFFMDDVDIKKGLLNLVRCLRNGAAHNSCMLSDLHRGESKIPKEIYFFIEKIDTISKNQRKKNLSSRPVLEFVTMLYVYNKIVSKNVKYYHLQELNKLFKGRMIEKKGYFNKNSLIINTYRFADRVLDYVINNS